MSILLNCTKHSWAHVKAKLGVTTREAQLGLEKGIAYCVQHEVWEAAAASPASHSAMTGSEQLICEALHWRYIRRYCPQLALTAHGMAGGGSRGDISNPEFLQG